MSQIGKASCRGGERLFWKRMTKNGRGSSNEEWQRTDEEGKVQKRTPPWWRRVKKQQKYRYRCLPEGIVSLVLRVPSIALWFNLQSAKLHQQSINHPHLKHNENTVWTNSQDYEVDEILHISKKRYFAKSPESQAKFPLFSGSTPIITNYSKPFSCLFYLRNQIICP